MRSLTRPRVSGIAGVVGTTAELSDNDLLPWHVNIHPGQGLDAWSSIVADALTSDLWPQGFLSYTSGNGAWLEASTYLAAGTWTLILPYDLRSDYPIVQTLVNGVNVGVPLDRYINSAASGVNYTVQNVPGIVIPTPQLVTVRVTSNGKNPAATVAYTLVWCGCHFVRTA